MSKRVTIDELAGMVQNGFMELRDNMHGALRTEITSLENKLNSRIEKLEAKLDYRFDSLSNRIDEATFI